MARAEEGVPMTTESWPESDKVLMLVGRHIGMELAFEKLERHAIVCGEPDVPLRAAGMVHGDHEYKQALLAWRPECELMPVMGYSA